MLLFIKSQYIVILSLSSTICVSVEVPGSLAFFPYAKLRSTDSKARRIPGSAPALLALNLTVKSTYQFRFRKPYKLTQFIHPNYFLFSHINNPDNPTQLKAIIIAHETLLHLTSQGMLGQTLCLNKMPKHLLSLSTD